MGKSSSRKKKRSDASPRARSRKSKSKKARNKLKKLRHHRDSGSYSSDYHSPGSSYTSSEYDYRRRRRSKSPAHGNTRGRKKRSRRRSYSSGSSKDSPPARKRRGSRKNDDLGARKKTYKKKHKRSVTISLTGSGSLSCSTCDSRSRHDGESEFESQRGRSRRRDRHNHEVRKDSTAAERSAYKTRSCSSCSKCSMSSHDQNEERVISANSSMRLRSVIMVTNHADERKLDKDENKEEILYDNDYPSSQSNDSNNGESRKGPALESHVESKMKGLSKDFPEAAPNTTGTLIDEKNGGSEEQFDGSNPSQDGVPCLALVKGKNGIVSDGAASEDLESVLRQRALENLKRYWEVSKGNGVSDLHRDNDDMKRAPAVTTVSTQMKFPEEVSARLADTTQHKGSSMSVWRRITTQTTSVDSNIGGRDHEAAKPSPSRGPIQVSGGGSLGGSLSANKQRMTPFTWRRDLAKTEPAAEKLPRLPKVPPQAKPLEVATGKDVDSVMIGTPVDKSGMGTEASKAVGSAVAEHSLSSCPKSVSQETNPAAEVKEEAEGPQYEQRTMSVTRGGETIQVSYQVYIPKRAPALARRQLRR